MKQMIIGWLAMLVAGTAGATSFSYQGVLRSATGGSVEQKNQNIAFRLYDGATTDNALWGRSVSVLLDDNGLFNVELSDSFGSPIEGLTNALDRIIAENATTTLYIGLTVDGSSGEIRPRQKLLSVPKASFAEDVQMAKKDFSVLGTATFIGDVQHMGSVEVKNQLVAKTISVEDTATVVRMKVTDTMDVSGSIALAKGASMTVNGTSALIPSGVIVMWSGAANAIPEGWALCNGSNGTPDLRDRFVIGAGGGYAVGAKGGAESVTLAIDQMPKHDHKYVGDDELENTYPYKDYADKKATSTGMKYDASSTTGSKGGPKYYYTSPVGEGKSHENRPPYYALCFIMKK